MTKLKPHQQKIADFVCKEIALGKGLRELARENEDVCQSTIYDWLNKYPEFAEQYTRAREEQADTHFDDIMRIADNTNQDVNDRRLRIDARKWVAGKLRPKKYGDKIDIGGNLNVRIGNDDADL